MLIESTICCLDKTSQAKPSFIPYSIHLLIFLEQCDLLPVTGEHHFLGI